MAKKKEAEYKPLLYTTTIRNPERFKDFMHVLKKYDNKILNDDTVKGFECDLFTLGLYRPTRIPESVKQKWASTRLGEYSDIPLTNMEAAQVYEMNDPAKNPDIKGHKDAGFEKGWQTRFNTQFILMKVLGFVYYNIGEPIRFSPLGNYLAESISLEINNGSIVRNIIAPEYEQMAFLQSFAKQQRCNPFIRELNDNIPLILLLEVIKKLNTDPEYNDVGISRRELPLLIFWKNNDAEALYRRIKQLRAEYGFNPSDEVIIDICTEEIMGGFKKFKPKSIISEYPDEFIRKMRLTGLITLRGAGRFIDINHNEDEKVEYILAHYSHYRKYTTEREYFDYMSKIDPNLFRIAPKAVDAKRSEELLNDWVDRYHWNEIKRELGILANKSASRDEVLKFIPAPARLEFLTALAIKSKMPNVRVVPNYPCDDEGLPTSTAGGDQGDIVCYENVNGILVEVTMSTGRTQTMMEVWPIKRHLEKLKKEIDSSVGYFIAPAIFADSISQINYVRDTDNLHFKPLSIPDFVSYMEHTDILYYK